MRGIAALGCLLGLAATGFGQDEVNFKVLEMPTVFSTIRQYKVTTIKSAKDWQSYWNRFVSANVEVGGEWKPMPLPDVDFKQFEIVAVHLGMQPNSGAKLGVSSALLDHEAYTVTVDQTDGPMSMMHSSNPAILIQLPKSRGPVSVVVKKEKRGATGNAHSTVHHSSLSTGGGL